MGAFTKPSDIANRSLQHCGAQRLDPVLGLSDQSRGALEISSCYNALRESELQKNVWTFATRRTILRALDANALLLDVPLWTEDGTYFIGSIVSDQSGNFWVSRIPDNKNNDPLFLQTYWEPYFGPLAVPLYASGIAYSSGEIVYTTPGDGTNRVYLSLQDGNSDNPATPTAWDPTAVYNKNQVVTYLALTYMSRINLNLNQVPSNSPANWVATTTYGLGATVAGSDNIVYSSLGGGNTGNDPTTTGGQFWLQQGNLIWSRNFVGGTGSAKWLQIGGTEFPSGVSLQQFGVAYPVGAGPRSQPRNVFKLPANYLRIAPQNPKGTVSYLGGPTGFTYNDWNIENGYLVTADTGPIAFRFVADMVDVRQMNSVFCEALGALIGMEICPTLTQSSTQVGLIAKIYSQYIDDARTANAIEAGYDDPPDDDYLTVRN